MIDIETLIKTLKLSKHPEGGYYRETYRAEESIDKNSLPDRFTGDRAFSTAIYFLLAENDISAFHRIKQDEIWHFYSGDPVIIHEIDIRGRYSSSVLGNNISDRQEFQIIVPAGVYFGAEVKTGPSGFALAGCTVAPGFDFADFEMPTRKELLNLYPQHEGIITRLTSN